MRSISNIPTLSSWLVKMKSRSFLIPTRTTSITGNRMDTVRNSCTDTHKPQLLKTPLNETLMHFLTVQIFLLTVFQYYLQHSYTRCIFYHFLAINNLQLKSIHTKKQYTFFRHILFSFIFVTLLIQSFFFDKVRVHSGKPLNEVLIRQ